jgi:hypothetical protein
MKTAILILLVVLFSFQVAGAQSQKQEFSVSESGLEAPGYKTVQILIIGNGLDKIGLTEERIRTKCELRLRQANLNPIPKAKLPLHYLGISVTVADGAFAIQVEFTRPVTFMVNGKEYWTLGTTWERNSAGTHGRDPEYVIQTLDRHLDDFLNDYLKANAK